MIKDLMKNTYCLLYPFISVVSILLLFWVVSLHTYSSISFTLCMIVGILFIANILNPALYFEVSEKYKV